MPIAASDQLDIFLSLFRGRQDVYARYWEKEDRVFLPRGFLNQLKIFLDQNQIAHGITDERPNPEPVKFASNIKLFPEQSCVVKEAMQKDCGVIVAPSGSGKTIIALSLVAQS